MKACFLLGFPQANVRLISCYQNYIVKCKCDSVHVFTIILLSYFPVWSLQSENAIGRSDYALKLLVPLPQVGNSLLWCKKDIESS